MHGNMEQPPRVAIVFCSHDRVHAGWAYDLVHLSSYFVARGGFVPETGKTFTLGFNWCMTSILPEGRHRLVEAIKTKPDVQKILWIDTDMRFPKEALHMLLRHDLPIVAANYVSRRPPFRFTSGTLDNTMLETRPGDTGLVEVGHVPFGFCLTDVSVFEDDGPWFAFDWQRDEENAARWKVIGEDVFFCREVRARGHKIFVDQELSNLIGHIGEFEYNSAVMQQIEMAPVE